MMNGEAYATSPFHPVIWRFTLNRMVPAERCIFPIKIIKEPFSLLLIDDNGGIVEEYSYDAWGNRRDESTLDNNYYPTGGNGVWQGFFHRGYTGHEHLECFGLINMNGRLYDPILGRMLSPDKYVQAPRFSQNFNRYSYAWNNPLTYSDPSGDIVITTAMIVTGIKITATFAGAYAGGSMANGTGNIGDWDFSIYAAEGVANDFAYGASYAEEKNFFQGKTRFMLAGGRGILNMAHGDAKNQLIYTGEGTFLEYTARAGVHLAIPLSDYLTRGYGLGYISRNKSPLITFKTTAYTYGHILGGL